MSQSVCLSSCIHRSVTYCRPPGGGHGPKGAAVGGIPCSDECIPLTGQWPFTISSQKNDIHWFFFSFVFFLFVFFFSPTFLTRWWHFHIFPKWQQRLQVTFRFMDGAQTLSRFCLFAVSSLLWLGPERRLVQKAYCNFSSFHCCCFFPPVLWELRCRMKIWLKKIDPEKHCREWFEWDGDLYD